MVLWLSDIYVGRVSQSLWCPTYNTMSRQCLPSHQWVRRVFVKSLSRCHSVLPVTYLSVCLSVDIYVGRVPQSLWRPAYDPTTRQHRPSHQLPWVCDGGRSTSRHVWVELGNSQHDRTTNGSQQVSDEFWLGHVCSVEYLIAIFTDVTAPCGLHSQMFVRQLLYIHESYDIGTMPLPIHNAGRTYVILGHRWLSG